MTPSTKVESSTLAEREREPIWKFLTLSGFWLVILLAPFLMLLIIHEFGVNVPAVDEWGLSLLVVKLHTGGFTWNDFWIPHNEHRILFLRVILLAMAKLGGWDIRKELYAS